MKPKQTKREARYAALFAALAGDAPIRPGPKGWTIEEVLALAGACKTAAKIYRLSSRKGTLPRCYRARGQTKNLNRAIDDREQEGGMLACLRDETVYEPLARALTRTRRTSQASVQPKSAVRVPASPMRRARATSSRT